VEPVDLMAARRAVRTRRRRVFLPRGVVIPCQVAGTLWYIKIRRFDAQGRPKNKAVRSMVGREAGVALSSC